MPRRTASAPCFSLRLRGVRLISQNVGRMRNRRSGSQGRGHHRRLNPFSLGGARLAGIASVVINAIGRPFARHSIVSFLIASVSYSLAENPASNARSSRV